MTSARKHDRPEAARLSGKPQNQPEADLAEVKSQAKSAWGTGKIWTQKAGCSPSCKCSFSSRWVGISLTTIKKHGAQPYYDRMAVEMRVGTKMHWFVGWFKNYPGATVPSWIFPLVWPYL